MSQSSSITQLILLCNRCHNSSPYFFSSCKTEALYFLNIELVFTLHFPSLHSSHSRITITVSVFMNLTTLSTLYKWNHTVFVFFNWIISLIKMLSRFTRVVTFWRIYFSFEGCIIFHCMCLQHFAYPFISCGHLAF